MFGGEQTLDSFGPNLSVVPFITLLVNGKPPSSEPHYLGEEVEISYTGKAGIGEPYTFDSCEWSVSSPAIKIYNTSAEAGECGYLEESDLTGHSFSFFLYDFSQEVSKKEISFRGKNTNFQFEKTFSLRYQRPVMEDFQESFPALLIATETLVIGTGTYHNQWFLGYSPQTHPDGVTVTPILNNNTGIQFEFAVFHLVLVDNWRLLDIEGYKQFQKTTPPRTFWFDGERKGLFPYGGLSYIYAALDRHSIMFSVNLCN